MNPPDTHVPDTQVPDTVTFRELQEIIRTFHGSPWRSMTLELRGLRVTIGKDGPPRSTAARAGTAPAQVTPGAEGAPTTRAAAGAAPATTSGTPASGTPTAGMPASATPASGTAGAAPARSEPTAPADRGTGPAAPDADPEGCTAVRSPAVGGFWVAPSPGQPPFVQVGQRVEADQQLAIVEVMKLMNPVVATAAGEVVAVCATNGDLVEYDQVLFWIRPDDA